MYSLSTRGRKWDNFESGIMVKLRNEASNKAQCKELTLPWRLGKRLHRLKYYHLDGQRHEKTEKLDETGGGEDDERTQRDAARVPKWIILFITSHVWTLV